MRTSNACWMAIVALLTFAAPTQAQTETAPAPAVSEEIEPRVIGTNGTTLVGFAGFIDKFFSSEQGLPTNYTVQVDVGRFITRAFVVRGGLTGSGSFGGEDADDRPSGVGAPALHAFGGLFYYFTPDRS